MTQPNKSAHNRPKKRTQGLRNRPFASTLPAQTLGWLSSVSLLSGGFVFAQTESSVEIVIPTVENSQPQKVATETKTEVNTTPAVVKTQPDFAARRARLKQKLSERKVVQTTESVTKSQPKAESSQPARITRTRKPQVEKSQIKEAATPVKPESQKPAKIARPVKNNQNTSSTTTRKAKDYNNAYIDPTEYKSSGTSKYEPPSSVVVTERSTGCEAIFSKREIAAGACGQKAKGTPRVADAPKTSAPTPSWIKKSEIASVKVAPTTNKTTEVAIKSSPKRQSKVVKAVAAAVNNNQTWRAPKTNSSSHTKTAYRRNRFIPQASEFSSTTAVSSTPVAPSFGTLPAPMAEGNVAPRPSNVSYDFALAAVLPQVPYSQAFAYSGGSGVMFPLSVASPVTSLFGWRTHPITGDRRFHAGTDLGAPTGTPILAAAKGQVETADWMGGYGLTVTVNHSSAQQTLYGHMSEILVRPGQWVEPGTVIGRVGSTGNSTGPHLHFEVRHLTANGWVAVNPGVKLQAGLNNLLDNNRLAQSR